VTNPASFDSRYFGPVSASAVIGVAHPVWLENAHDGRRFAAAVHLIVPSGVSFCWPSPCRRACSAVHSPHFALPSAQPSNVQASCLERARPAATFAGALAARAAAAGPPLPGATARGKGGRQDKGAAPVGPQSQSARGVARHGFAVPPREARADAGMSACFARPDTPSLQGAAMTDRRDDDFRPSAPKNRGQGFVSKVLKQAGKASSGKSSVRRPGGWRQGTGQRPGSRLGRGHTAARFAGAKLTPMSRRVTIKTLLVNQRGPARSRSPSTCATSSATAWAAMASRAGPTGRRPTKPTSTPSRNAAPTTGTISASSSRPRMAPSWKTCAPTRGT
jgi:hypothetical protein